MVPAHIGPERLATILTAGVTKGSTVTVIGLDVAFTGETHVPFEDTFTRIHSPDAKVEVLKAVLFVPLFTPFTCHW